MTETGLYDHGLQPERTYLAWRRSALAIAVGSIISLRILPTTLESVLWYVPGTLGVGFAVWVWWIAGRRYQEFNAASIEDEAARPSGGGPLVALAVFIVLLGLLAMTILFFGGWRL